MPRIPFLNRLRANKITPAAVLSIAIRSPAGEMMRGRVAVRVAGYLARFLFALQPNALQVAFKLNDLVLRI